MLRSHQPGRSLVNTVIVRPHSMARHWVSTIADMIVSGFEGVMSIDGVYNSSRGKLHTMSLVSTKSTIESIVFVAAILDYFNVTLPHVNGDDHIGFLCTCNVYGRLKTAFLYSITVRLY